MVRYGARYEANALIQMRVHDVNVLTDLDAVNPTSPDPEEPVECDGTDKGNGQLTRVYTTEAYETGVQESGENIDSWWVLEFFWPLLHVAGSYPVSSILFMVHFTVDLLGSFSVIQSAGGDPEVDYLMSWAQVFAAVALCNAAYQVAIGFLAVAEFCARSPDPFTKSMFPWTLGAGIALMVGTTAVAVWYAESKVQAGEWLHAQAFTFYFGFMYIFLRYLIGFASVKGIISYQVLSLLMVHMGSTAENAIYCLEQMAKPLAWTKLVILGFLVFYCAMAAYHFSMILG